MTVSKRDANVPPQESADLIAQASLFATAEWGALRAALHLSKREAEVVDLVLQDRTELDIGDLLGISPHTVHTHLVRVYRKVGARSRLSLAVAVFSEYRTFELARLVRHSS